MICKSFRYFINKVLKFLLRFQEAIELTFDKSEDEKLWNIFQFSSKNL